MRGVICMLLWARIDSKLLAAAVLYVPSRYSVGGVARLVSGPVLPACVWLLRFVGCSSAAVRLVL